ncbi:MAG: CPBP family intramembrane glutamic endopeptidase [Agathobacter sp.]
MSKQTEQKRLLLYLVFVFGLSSAFFFAYIMNGGIWEMEDGIGGMEQFVGLGMLCPTIAMLLTRYVTGEGFAVTGKDSMLLGINFRDKKWVYFLMAVLLPWLYTELGNGLNLLLSPGAFDPDYPKVLGIPDDQMGIVFLQPLSAIVSATIISFGALGEEAGWRGYMMPKMIKFWGVPKAIVIGGIIWGIWHWPLTYIGHNFGRNYQGYPFTGFAAMCVMCIFMGILLTYLVNKSGSIWPAVFMHGVNNASPSILLYFINPEKISGWKSDPVAGMLIGLIPMVVITLFLVYFEKRATMLMQQLNSG